VENATIRLDLGQNRPTPRHAARYGAAWSWLAGARTDDCDLSDRIGATIALRSAAMPE